MPTSAINVETNTDATVAIIKPKLTSSIPMNDYRFGFLKKRFQGNSDT
jgi:hypothetical protein